MKIKVGQSVTFVAQGGGVPDFLSHPIGANGGDPGNPITNIDTDTGEATFPTAGTFGFTCTNHPAMIGAIQVTE